MEGLAYTATTTMTSTTMATTTKAEGEWVLDAFIFTINDGMFYCSTMATIDPVLHSVIPVFRNAF